MKFAIGLWALAFVAHLMSYCHALGCCEAWREREKRRRKEMTMIWLVASVLLFAGGCVVITMDLGGETNQGTIHAH